MTSPPTSRILLQHLRTFLRLARGQVLFLVPLMLVAGLFEGVGIVLFLPVLEQLSASGGAVSVASPAIHSMLTTLRLTSLPLLLIAVAVVFIVKFAVTLLQQVAIQRVTRDLYRALARTLLRGWAASDYRVLYLQTTSGTLTNALTRELWTFLSAFSYTVVLIVSAVYIAVYLVGSFLLDPRIAALAVSFGCVVALALRRWTGIAGRHSLAFSEENIRFHDRLTEFLQHFKYLKATAQFPAMLARLDDRIAQMTAHQYRMGIVGATMTALPEPIAIIILLVFLGSSVAVFGNAFATTAVLALLLYRTLMRILTLQTSWQKFVGCSGALRAVEDALARVAAHPEPQGSARITSIADGVRFDRVHFAYQDRPILTNVSLSFPARRTVALVGPSGGGKSTIVDLLTGVLRPTAGHVTVDGTHAMALHPDALRALVGYVAQDIVMFNDTIANNVTLWAHASDDTVRQRCTDASCDFIEQLPQQYDTPVGERGIALSVGQRQRIAIARELFRDPRILIFDEATSALDAESEEVIRKHIARLAGTRTIVLIAHRLSTIRHADYIYVIDGGRVMEEGTFDELHGNPQSAFRTMCDLQRVGADVQRSTKSQAPSTKQVQSTNDKIQNNTNVCV